MTHTVLLVDDDAAVREALAQTLELADLRAIPTGSFVAAKDHITREFPGVVLSDIRMPGRDGFHLLSYARAVDDELPVVLLTGEGDIPMAVDAMEKGAFDFLEKPCASNDLLAVLQRAFKARETVLAARLEQARRDKGDPAARLIFGVSDLAAGLRARVRRVAASDAEVALAGPPGSGISKVAEVIHLCSPRAQAPFEKRAAKGLTRDALKEAFALAGTGSLYLDEITQSPADTQIALIEYLEGDHPARVLVGSTSEWSEASLNPDLFYRLDVGKVRIPSLAERPDDIPVLFAHYVAQASEQAGLKPPEITAAQVSALMSQSWPGNARSVMNAAMRFVLGMPEDMIESHELGLVEQMARVEKALLIAALGRHNGHASDTARALKLPRKTFYDKLARYAIRPEDFRR